MPMQDMTTPETTQRTPDSPVPIRDEILEQAEAKTKELLSQIKAALQLWKVQNEGKAPEINDIMEMLQPKTEDYDPSEPRILSFKIFHGRNPQTPVYYYDPSTSGYFDTHARNWANDRPPLCEHLTERDIGTSDVFDAILHGVMDDQDYAALEKMNIIDDRSKQLWKKLSTLATQTNMMMKSVEGEENPDAPAPKLPNVPSPEAESSSGSNPFQQIKAGAGVKTEAGGQTVETAPQGTNVLAQIMAGAQPRSQSQAASEPVDYDLIHGLIRAEIAHMMGEDPLDVYGHELSSEDISNHFKNLEFPHFGVGGDPAPSEDRDSMVYEQAMMSR